MFFLLYKYAPSFSSMLLLLFTSKWLAMEKLPKSQVAKGVFLLILLLFIPFISSSLRPSYRYFLLNILIIALGAEAGFLKAISRPRDDKKAPKAIVAVPITVEAAALDNDIANKVVNRHEWIPQAAKPAQNVAKVAPRVKALRRCPSKPSLFFIGGSEGESEVKEEEEEKWEQAGELSKQELFSKAEAFIGNFYMQLKMQREESWKKIHGFYHRAF